MKYRKIKKIIKLKFIIGCSNMVVHTCRCIVILWCWFSSKMQMAFKFELKLVLEICFRKRINNSSFPSLVLGPKAHYRSCSLPSFHQAVGPALLSSRSWAGPASHRRPALPHTPPRARWLCRCHPEPMCRSSPTWSWLRAGLYSVDGESASALLRLTCVRCKLPHPLNSSCMPVPLSYLIQH